MEFVEQSSWSSAKHPLNRMILVPALVFSRLCASRSLGAWEASDVERSDGRRNRLDFVDLICLFASELKPEQNRAEIPLPKSLN